MLEYNNEDEAQLIKTLITGETFRLSIISKHRRSFLTDEDENLETETNGSADGVIGFGSESAPAPPPHKNLLSLFKCKVWKGQEIISKQKVYFRMANKPQ